ncbi:MAG: hypothetical protein NTW23_04620 [Rhodoluna sp.]|nr:hypothetical protein [Rhodoluna sp.]
MADSHIYRTRSNWIYLVVIALVGILAAISYFSIGNIYDGFIATINTAAICAIMWVVMIYPKIVYSNSGIEIHNPFQTIQVGWLRAEDFVTKYAFTVVTAEKKFSSWAAPSSSRIISRNIHDTDYKGTGLESRKVIATSDSPRSESGAALVLALRYSQNSVNAGTAGEHLVRKINILTVAVCVVSIGILVYTLSQ